ncbi:MAG: biotin/lipoyl-binding protein, partial [Nitrospirales bacterium]|nr:biotin/lipoyl-binding protein [Nitrospirales bacterium]
MAQDELSRLKIDKTSALPAGGRKRNFIWIIAAILATLTTVFLWITGVFTPAVEVETAAVSRIFPSQTFTLLNASGYVVAQRKASVASKVTGRLVSLLVEEGSKVRKGDIIARIESDDVLAAKERAMAGLEVARHNLEQARAEMDDASKTFDRKKELLPYGFSGIVVRFCNEAVGEKLVLPEIGRA